MISLTESIAPPPKDTHYVLIDTEHVSVLSQQRSEMSQEGLSELSSSIKSSGQIYPGIIFAFTKSEAVKYIKEINKLWGSNHNLRDFNSVFISEKNRYYFLFLVAGHRRLSACKLASVKYYVQIIFNSSFEKAINIQLEENFHENVSLKDQIRSAHALWIRAKMVKPNVSLREFSKKIHKSVTWLKNALRFANLPVSIQQLISYKGDKKTKGISYRVLLEFASLYEYSSSKEAQIDEEKL